MDHWHDPAWREVILHSAFHLIDDGHRSDAIALIQHLLESTPIAPATWYHTIMLVGAFVEVVMPLPVSAIQSIKSRVVHELVTLIDGGYGSFIDRIDAALLLGRFGDPRLRMPDQAAYWCTCPAERSWVGRDHRRRLTETTLPTAFNIGRTPVTNAAYARFVEADDYTQQRWWTAEGWAFLQSGRDPWTDVDQQHPIIQPQRWTDPAFMAPLQPVVGVSCHEAMAYCAWLSAELGRSIRLPTVVEWERAARHTDQRRYPWGDDTPTPEHANYYATGIARPTPVGCFPQGNAVCGATDMSGNVSEWLASSPSSPYHPDPITEFSHTTSMLISANDFTSTPSDLYCGYQRPFLVTARYPFLGFRLCSPDHTKPVQQSWCALREMETIAR